MKKIMFLVMSILFIGSSVCAESNPKEVSTSSAKSSSLVKKALYVAVGTGAVASGLYWGPLTGGTINRYGILGAILSTHIPRMLIDVATLAACSIAYSDECDKEEK